MPRFPADRRNDPIYRNGNHHLNGRSPVFFKTPTTTAWPLNILMTTDTIGGVWTYSLDLAKALIQKGHQVFLATMGSPLSDKQRDEIDQTPRLETYESSYKLEWMDNPWQDIEQAGQWLLQLERYVCPDLIHLNGYAHGALPWQTPTVMVGHSCVMSWWQAVKGEPPPTKWDQYRQHVKQGLQAADAVLAPTQAMLNALERHYGPLPNSGVVPNGRDPDLFWADQKKPFIFTASRVWDEAKNIVALEAVAPHLPWPVFVAGEDKHPNGRSVQLHHMNLLGRLTFEELQPWFAQASIYALPARYEPFGLSALEAAMAGCALVLGDIPSLREVWGNAALYVPPNDSEALEIALSLLIIDPAYRRMMARRAHTHAQIFTSERMANRYLSVYQELVQSVRMAA